MTMQIPHTCPRGRTDCIALANIVSNGSASFFCCGENNGRVAPVKEDKYTVCFKGEFRDDIRFYDKRDLIHHASVILQAVAVVERDILTENQDWSPWNDQPVAAKAPVQQEPETPEDVLAQHQPLAKKL